MAAPHVSGACALLLSANPLLTCEELQEILTTTGDPIASGICSSNSRLNVYKALRAAIPPDGDASVWIGSTTARKPASASSWRTGTSEASASKWC